MPATIHTRRPTRGFTLIELLIAVSILAVIGVLGWRTLDTMHRASTQVREHAQAVLTLETALAQWGVDLEATVESKHLSAMDWDGRALRITRSHSTDASQGLIVVAWTRDTRDGRAQWLRWQSEPVRSREAWTRAWISAAAWAQSPTEAAKQREVVITPLGQWQIFYHRGGAWSNPLSSAGTPAPSGAGGSADSTAPLPDGVRLVLTLPRPHPLAGTITRDWVRPTVHSGSS